MAPMEGSAAGGTVSHRKRRKRRKFDGNVDLQFSEAKVGSMSRDEKQRAIRRIRKAQQLFESDRRNQEMEKEQIHGVLLRQYEDLGENLVRDRETHNALQQEVQQKEDALPDTDEMAEKRSQIEALNIIRTKIIETETAAGRSKGKRADLQKDVDKLNEEVGEQKESITPEDHKAKQRELKMELARINQKYAELREQEADTKEQEQTMLAQMRIAEQINQRNQQDTVKIEQHNRELMESKQNLRLDQKRLDVQRNKFEQYKMNSKADIDKMVAETQQMVSEKSEAESVIKRMSQEAGKLLEQSENFDTIDQDVTRLGEEQTKVKRDGKILKMTATIAEQDMQLGKERADIEDKLADNKKQDALLGERIKEIPEEDASQMQMLRDNLSSDNDRLRKKLAKVEIRETKVQDERDELESYKRTTSDAVDHDLNVALGAVNFPLDIDDDVDTTSKVYLLQASRGLKDVTDRVIKLREQMRKTKVLLEDRTKSMAHELQGIESEKAKVDPTSGELEKQQSVLEDLRARWDEKEKYCTKENRQYERKKRKIDKEAATVEAQAQEVEEQRGELLTEQEKLREEISGAQRRQEDAAVKLANFELKRQEGRQNLAKDKYQLAYDRKRIQDERVMLDNKRAQISKKKKDLTKWSAKIADRRGELSDAEETLRREKSGLREMEDKIKAKARQYEELRSQLEEDKDTIELLQSEDFQNELQGGKSVGRGRGGHQQSEFFVLKAELMAVREDLTNEKNEFVKEKTRMRITMKDITKKRAKINEELAQLRELNSEIGDMRKSLEQVQVQMQKEEEEHSENRKISENVRRDLRKCIAGFKSYQHARQAMQSETEIIEAERAHIKIQSLDLIGELKKIADELEAMQERLADLADQKKKLQEDDQLLSNREESVNDAIRNKNKANKKIQARMHELQEQKKKYEDELENYEREKARLDEERRQIEADRPKDDLQLLQDKIREERGFITAQAEENRTKNKALTASERELEQLRVKLETERQRLDETARNLDETKRQLIEMTETVGNEKQRLTKYKITLENQRQDVSLARREAEMEKESLEVMRQLVEERKQIERQKEEIQKLMDAVGKDFQELMSEKDTLQTHLDRMEDIDEGFGGQESIIARELRQLAEEKKRNGQQKKELMTIIKKVAEVKNEHEIQKKDLLLIRQRDTDEDRDYYRERKDFELKRRTFHKNHKQLLTNKDEVEENMIKWAKEQVVVQQDLEDMDRQIEVVNDFKTRLGDAKHTLEDGRDTMHKIVDNNLGDVFKKIPIEFTQEKKGEELVAWKVMGAGGYPYHEYCNGVYRPQGGVGDDGEGDDQTWKYEDEKAGKAYELWKDEPEDEDGIAVWVIQELQFDEYEQQFEVEYYNAEVDSMVPPSDPAQWDLYEEDGQPNAKGPGPTIVPYDPIAEAKAAQSVIPASVGPESEGLMGGQRKRLWEHENGLLERVTIMKENLFRATSEFTSTHDKINEHHVHWTEMMEVEYEITEKVTDANRICMRLKTDNQMARFFGQQKKKSPEIEAASRATGASSRSPMLMRAASLRYGSPGALGTIDESWKQGLGGGGGQPSFLDDLDDF